MLTNRNAAALALAVVLRRLVLFVACVLAPLCGLLGIVLMWYGFGAAFRGDVNLGLGASVLGLLGFVAAALVIVVSDWVRGLFAPADRWDAAVRKRETMREEASWPTIR